MNMSTRVCVTLPDHPGERAPRQDADISRLHFLPLGRIGAGPDSLSTDPGPAPAPEGAVIIKMAVLFNQKATHSTA